MGEGEACGDLLFPGTGCPVPNAGYIHLVWNYCYMGYRLYIYSPPWDVFVHDPSFR